LIELPEIQWQELQELISHLQKGRRLPARDGLELPYSLQACCRVNKKLTIYSCLLCIDRNATAAEARICYSKSGRVCFATHITSCHDEYLEDDDMLT
jgi:hypothetical protein